MNDVGLLIKIHRKLKGFTQQKLADKAGISVMSIKRYENGKRYPDTEMLEKISNALGITLAEFFFGAGAKTSIDEDLVSLYAPGMSLEDLKNEALKTACAMEEGLLLSLFRRLNEVGQDEAVKRVEELTYIEKYTKKD